jgi:phospholipid:diacylglycerol acyltransferase
MGEGDGTVSLLYRVLLEQADLVRSSGYMCVKGWKMDRYNPSKIPIITHEMDHEPEFLDLRGGPKTAGMLLL